MTAPAGSEIGLYVDLIASVAIGDVVETRSGRRYGVLSVRVQAGGKNAGRQHLRCVVLGEDDERHAFEWVGSRCGIVTPLANAVDEYPVGSWEPCVLCDSPVNKACRATVRRRSALPRVHRIRWYRRIRGSGSGGVVMR